MLQKITRTLYLILGVGMLAAACTQPTTTPQDAAEPSHQPSQPESQPSQPESQPPVQPIDAAGPTVGSFIIWVDKSEFVFVPGSEFIMGAGGQDNPEKTVNVSPFWIHRAEVTNQMYAACVAAGNCTVPKDEQSRKDLNDRFLQERPVTGVDWEQADAYCKWIEGRLPTEAEWEKTARGPDGNIFPWGEEAATCDYANFGTCLNKTSRVKEHPVGKSYYEALGLAGNVFEWVKDWYDPLYYPNAPDQDPQGPANGTKRVVRGGGYASPDYHLPSAMRFSDKPEEYRRDLGFRCVLENIAPRASYCVASQITQNIPSYPQSDKPQSGSGCSYGYVDFDKPVSSVESELDCVITGNRVRCTGPAGTSGKVIVCREGDSGSTSTTGPTGGYCAPGYLPTANNSCTYDGSNLIPNNCNGAICIQPGFGDSGEPICPIGMYFDNLSEQCVGTEIPSENCISGFAYDAANGCCVSNTNSYPGCPEGQFETPQGCVPGGSSSTSTGGYCEEITITTGTCAPPTKQPGGNDEPETPETGLTCPPGQKLYCWFDTQLNQTVCSCY